MDHVKPALYTVGHSVHSIDHFIQILKQNRVKAVADVRSLPYSEFTPQFNREVLKDSLSSASIKYVFLGEELGARRNEAECYEAGKVLFRKVAALPAFQRGILRLQEGAVKMRVAIMCAEKDPLTCHRTVLVAHFAHEYFSDIYHILEDGSIETHKEANNRLLRECKLDKEDFFSSYDERLAQAYEMRGAKISYEEVPSQAKDKMVYG